MRRDAGFTLVELMIAIALIAIVATLAVPSWGDFVRHNRTVATTNDFVTALHYARSEAIRRNAEISICPSSDDSACTGGEDWSVGWIAYRGADPDSPDRVLRVWAPVADNASMDGPGSELTYLADGAAATTADFALALHGCRGEGRRDISVTLSGRPYTEERAC